MTKQFLAALLLVIPVISISAAAQSNQSASDFLKLGNAELAKGNLEAAISNFTNAIRLNSGLPPALMGSVCGGNESSEIATSDDFNACAFNNRGIAYSRLGELESALADFGRALRINPRLADAHSNRGNVYQARGESEKALRDFDQAIKLDPRHNRAFNNRANLLLAKGELDAAINDYNRSIELDSSNALAFANRGLTLLQLGRDEEAGSDFKRALKLNPALKNNLNELAKQERLLSIWRSNHQPKGKL